MWTQVWQLCKKPCFRVERKRRQCRRKNREEEEENEMFTVSLISVLPSFAHHKRFFSFPTVFFKDRGWCTCTSARVKLSPQRGGGWLNHETEMKYDEWLITEVRWMTPNVTMPSSVQSKQNMCGSAFMHINQRTSESQMLTALFLYNYTGLETWSPVHQYLPGDAVCFWMRSALLECWDTRDSQHTPPF